ncbi:hypothetical protein BC936DRAFT_146131 [Jimgerdemannia flammicorona]|uniref:Uncharacterized protein n=1 Tax=Jimgerdemannia flammicorona TaxID=994334 RepID=A0A433D8E2_9FUNG|nr:hypothetical protein BC936DRAFT_146131 [Jimgerdemannia flammicorona]
MNGDVTFLTSSTMSPATSRTTEQKLFSFHSSPSQKLMSLMQGGYLENGWNLKILPPANWSRKRGSCDQKRRMSGMSKRTIARRSRPKPKAQPILSVRPVEIYSLDV